ncbi:hypothetical protein DW794_06630 [Bacteroides caccae]|uniref:Uncharacterized protein n=1 Tax=Bacteroides caccae TaxID=47678 RepID=A0A414FN49_9BACE|nr:hypothetical protein DW794_06630 [Bacteroides caccae]
MTYFAKLIIIFYIKKLITVLNHIDELMKVIDIYIERDFVSENKANSKVINLCILQMDLVIIYIKLESHNQ